MKVLKREALKIDFRQLRRTPKDLIEAFSNNEIPIPIFHLLVVIFDPEPEAYWEKYYIGLRIKKISTGNQEKRSEITRVPLWWKEFDHIRLKKYPRKS